MKIRLNILFLLLPLLSAYSEQIDLNSASIIDDMTTASLPSEMLYRAHPWHGIPIGSKAPEIVNCFIEIVPSDTVKYEIDKETGILMIDRPNKYSTICPTLYGFIPRTYSGSKSAAYMSQKTGKDSLIGDGDALDICVLTEKEIPHGDIIVKAIPIGGFRMIDTNEADDKIIAVLEGDFLYGDIKDISECPEKVLDRLKHYFLTYKDAPDRGAHSKIHIHSTYGREEAYEVIKNSQGDYLDYINKFEN